MTSSQLLTQWFWVPQARPEATLRLFCFPHAGGDAPSFAALARSLPEDIELWAVRMPGRGTRLHERQSSDLDDLVNSIARAMLPLISGRYALLGQSLGSVVAYEVGRRLAVRNPPAGCVITALPPPHLWHLPIEYADRVDELALLRRTGDVPLADLLPDGDPAYDGERNAVTWIRATIDRTILGALSSMDSTAHEVLAHPELRELAVAAIRADLALCYQYRHRLGTSLACPLYAAAGTGDTAVDAEQMAEWRGYTTGPFSLDMVPGGHLIVQTGGDQFHQSIVDFLRSCTRQGLERE